MLPMCSKAICLGVSKPTACMAAHSKIHALCHQLAIEAFVKEKEKSICVKEICKILEIYWWILFPTNNYLPLESCQLCIIA